MFLLARSFVFRRMVLFIPAILLNVFFGAIQQVEALPARVKIRLFSTHKVLQQILVTGRAEIIEPRHIILPDKVFIVDTSGGGVSLRSRSGARLFSHENHLVLSGYTGLAIDSQSTPRIYKGKITFSALPKRLHEKTNSLEIINEVDTRSYITSCVGSETLPSFGAEALKAQAVLCTTLMDKTFHDKIINDSTEAQSYLGSLAERPLVKAAVNEVFGEELYFNGHPIDVFFCSTCGGTTTTPSVLVAKSRLDDIHISSHCTVHIVRTLPF